MPLAASPLVFWPLKKMELPEDAGDEDDEGAAPAGCGLVSACGSTPYFFNMGKPSSCSSRP